MPAVTPGLGRRSALILAGVGTVAGGRAARAQSGRVRAWPVPCASGTGEIAGIVLEGRGAPAGTVTVFGMTFAPGEVPRGAGLAARLEAGGALPAQLDVVTRHADGSARFGVVALAAPALRQGEPAGVVLRRAQGSLRPLDAGAALEGRRAVLEVGAAGRRGWQVDLADMTRRTLAEGGGFWQSGPLAVQRRLVRSVPAEAVGGATSMRCVADVTIQSDGVLRVDAWLRNDVAMRPGGGPAAYDVRLALDGRPALAATGLRQHHYTAWGRSVASLPDGTPAPAPPHVRQDTERLSALGAIARYDLQTGVDEGHLHEFTAAMARPDWADLFSPRAIMQDMFAGGARPDIGQATRCQAIWLMTGDPRAATYAIGQAEASGAIPWHFWDQEAGGWLDTRRWPELWTDYRGRRPPTGLLQQVSGDTGWAADTAHQPDLSYVPYLLTGRRAFLDGIQAQASWSVMSRPTNPLWGRGTQGGLAEGVNLTRAAQVRGAAWSLRQIGNAAWANPAGDAQLAWSAMAEQANWAWIRSRIPAWTSEQGEAHGWIRGEYGTPGALPPWQQDMFASAAGAAARRGQADARAVLAWMENFLAGRFLAAGRGFNPRDGCAYLIAISAPEAWGRPFTTWARIAAETEKRGWSNGTGWSQSGANYGAWALQSLAVLIDVLGSEPARRAWTWLEAAGAPFTAPPDKEVQLAILPRGHPRSRVGAQACRANSQQAGRRP